MLENKNITNNKNVLSSIVNFLKHSRFEILLCSFMLLIFGNTFAPQSKGLTIFLIYQNFITGLLVFYNKKWTRNLIISIILLNFGIEICQAIQPVANSRTLHTSLYLLFFVLVTKEVFKEVLFVKTVSRELLAAALCGFVLLCLIATFIFSFVDIYYPNSFSNVDSGNNLLNNLNYFSFTTMLTLGFGDIAPQTLIAKRAVMLMGLAGHFYTVFVTSIIIGKYLSAKNK
jgi:voltage-gated potassium channel